jgi:hypothetical protein
MHQRARFEPVSWQIISYNYVTVLTKGKLILHHTKPTFYLFEAQPGCGVALKI